MKSYLLKSLCSVFALAFVSTTIFAQVKGTIPTPFGEKELVSWNFHSKIIGEDYTIYVHYPPGYDTTKTKYPVLYMTDGDWNMTVAMNCFRMLRQDYETTEPLIVGIGYGDRKNMRSRDLDPHTGGPNFIAFIEKEVMPFINSTYRVTDNKALYGYSYGGMFTTMVLFSHPDLFNTIFIGAPGNAGSELIPTAEKYFTDHKDLTTRVFLGVGSFEPQTAQNIGLFKDYMLKRNLKNFDIATVIIPNAGHGASLGAVMQSAMKFAYCKTHKAINVPVADLQRYTGNYVVAAEPTSKINVYVENNKLYFKQGNNLPQEFTPYTKDGFFMYENERANITFKNDKGKMYMEFAFPGEAPTRLDKVN